MIVKTKLFNIEIESILIIVILISILSKTVFKFLYYFFACYLFILFHELMHIFVATILDKKLLRVKFSIAGTCAVFQKEKYTNSDICTREMAIYLAGPLSNLILAYIFRNNIIIREINIFLAIINFLPVFPLDGYNVLFNMLKLLIKEENVYKIIDKIGNIVIILLVALSVYQILEHKQITLIIFSIYLFVLKISKKNN